MLTPSKPSTAAVSSLWKESRRSSPSVTTGQPASSCSAITSRTARSSMRLKSLCSSAPASCARRASSRYAGRSRLPTCSARAVTTMPRRYLGRAPAATAPDRIAGRKRSDPSGEGGAPTCRRRASPTTPWSRSRSAAGLESGRTASSRPSDKNEGGAGMPIPIQCQTYADEIARLTAEKKSLQEDVSELTGSAKWQRLAGIRDLVEQIAQQQRALEQCILQNAPGYETEVVILPAPGATVSLPAEGQLWELRPPSPQREIESRTIVGGRIKFVHAGSIRGASIGISIREPASSTSNGPLFRSGPLASLPPGSPADPAGLIEIGAAASVVVSSAEGAALPLPSVPFSPPGAPLPIVITSITPPTLGTGEITLGVGGTATVSQTLLNTIGLGNIVGPSSGASMTIGFAYTLAFGLVPSANMNDVGEAVLVVPSRPGTLTAMTTIGPVFDLVLNLIAPMVEPVLRPFAT